MITLLTLAKLCFRILIGFLDTYFSQFLWNSRKNVERIENKSGVEKLQEVYLLTSLMTIYACNKHMIPKSTHLTFCVCLSVLSTNILKNKTPWGRPHLIIITSTVHFVIYSRNNTKEYALHFIPCHFLVCITRFLYL